MTSSVFTIFRELMTKNQPIHLINNFNGVTVSNPSLVLGFNNVSVKLSINKYQGVILQQGNQTLMVTEICPEAIVAKVDIVNLIAREAYFADFRFVEKLCNNRGQVRICPRQEIIANFSEYPEVQGKIRDISFDGLGFFVPREDTNYERFAKGEKLMLNMNLPLNGVEKNVQVPCEIKKVFLESEELRLRIGVKTQPDAESKKIISSYITQNMVEICNELDKLYKEQVKEPVVIKI
jgi:hypothetical protein